MPDVSRLTEAASALSLVSAPLASRTGAIAVSDDGAPGVALGATPGPGAGVAPGPATPGAPNASVAGPGATPAPGLGATPGAPLAATPGAPSSDTGTAAVLDANGADTKLSAAAATVSRETSGIAGDGVESTKSFTVNQGRTVESTGPDGVKRSVRIVGPAL